MATQFDTWFIVIVSFGSCAGCLVNSCSALRMWKTYNLKHVLYFILFVNSVLTSVSLMCTLIVTFQELFVQDAFQDSANVLLQCCLLFDAMFVSHWTSALSVCLISFLR